MIALVTTITCEDGKVHKLESKHRNMVDALMQLNRQTVDIADVEVRGKKSPVVSVVVEIKA